MSLEPAGFNGHSVFLFTIIHGYMKIGDDTVTYFGKWSKDQPNLSVRGFLRDNFFTGKFD